MNNPITSPAYIDEDDAKDINEDDSDSKNIDEDDLDDINLHRYLQRG